MRDTTLPSRGSRAFGCVSVLISTLCGLSCAWGSDANTQPQGGEELIATTKIVPGRDLNGGGDENGRGDYPHIPKNGYLPDRLCGLDTNNKVRLALYVTLDRAVERDVEIIYDISSLSADKITIESGFTIKVIVSAGKTWAYSNPNCAKALDLERTFVVKGVENYLSGSPGTMKAKVKVPPPGFVVRDGDGDILVYKFTLDFKSNGAPLFTNDEEVRNKGEKFDGDLCIGPPTDAKFEGLDITGYEHTGDSKLEVLQILMDQHGYDRLHKLRVSDLDGASLVANKSDTAVDKAIVYTKTSDDSIEAERGLYGNGGLPPMLANGDPTRVIEEIYIEKGRPGHLKFRVAKKDAGVLRIKSDGNTYLIKDDFVSRVDGGRDELVGSTVSSEYHNDPATITISAVPSAAFSGKASCKVMAKRDLKWDILSRTHSGGNNAVIALLSALPLSWGGIKFGSLVISAIPVDKGQASGVIAANMAYGVRQGTEIVRGSDTLYRLAENQLSKSNVEGDPYRESATATSAIWSFVNTDINRGDFSQKTNEDFQPVAFKVGVTELPFWLSGTSQTNKSTPNSMSYAWINWAKIELEAKIDEKTKHTSEHPFRIWELN